MHGTLTCSMLNFTNCTNAVIAGYSTQVVAVPYSQHHMARCTLRHRTCKVPAELFFRIAVTPSLHCLSGTKEMLPQPCLHVICLRLKSGDTCFCISIVSYKASGDSLASTKKPSPLLIWSTGKAMHALRIRS